MYALNKKKLKKYDKDKNIWASKYKFIKECCVYDTRSILKIKENTRMFSLY